MYPQFFGNNWFPVQADPSGGLPSPPGGRPRHPVPPDRPQINFNMGPRFGPPPNRSRPKPRSPSLEEFGSRGRSPNYARKSRHGRDSRSPSVRRRKSGRHSPNRRAARRSPARRSPARRRPARRSPARRSQSRRSLTRRGSKRRSPSVKSISSSSSMSISPTRRSSSVEVNIPQPAHSAENKGPDAPSNQPPSKRPAMQHSLSETSFVQQPDKLVPENEHKHSLHITKFEIRKRASDASKPTLEPMIKKNCADSSKTPSQNSDPSKTLKNSDMNITPNLLEEFMNALKSKSADTETSSSNIIPEFDPLSKQQTISRWLLKVDECAEVYGWNEVKKIHFALAKLTGLAKVWYESLLSVEHSWVEWKCMLRDAFPAIDTSENYAEILKEMLSVTARTGESFDSYFHTKINLLNRCRIYGKQAVDCIVDGIKNKAVRDAAQAEKFDKPEILLQCLKAVKVSEDIPSNHGNQASSGQNNNTCAPNTTSNNKSDFQSNTNQLGHGIASFDSNVQVQNNVNRPSSHVSANIGSSNTTGFGTPSYPPQAVQATHAQGFQHSVQTVLCNTCNGCSHKSNNNPNYVPENMANGTNVYNQAQQSMVCCTCNGYGHQSNNCPNYAPQNMASDKTNVSQHSEQPKVCYICNENDHMTNDCPNYMPENIVSNETNVSEQPKKSLVCLNCKEHGHRYYNCPSEIIKCSNCNKFGHEETNCIKNKSIKSVTPVTCKNCNKQGHFSYCCPKPKQQCMGCLKFGHIIKHCYLTSRKNFNPKCFKCGVRGHCAYECEDSGNIIKRNTIKMKKVKNCPKPKIKCTFCLYSGHQIENCPKKGDVPSTSNAITQDNEGVSDTTDAGSHQTNADVAITRGRLCFNCKERGHSMKACPKPIKQCSNCKKIGHEVKDCWAEEKNQDAALENLDADKGCQSRTVGRASKHTADAGSHQTNADVVGSNEPYGDVKVSNKPYSDVVVPNETHDHAVVSNEPDVVQNNNNADVLVTNKPNSVVIPNKSNDDVVVSNNTITEYETISELVVINKPEFNEVPNKTNIDVVSNKTDVDMVFNEAMAHDHDS